MTGFDLAVIGGGSGGLSVAAAAAQFGQRVVLFEKHQMGGDCLNTGCVPSKALIAAAKAAHAARTSARLGISADNVTIDFTAVMQHVQGAIAAIAPHDSVERFEGLGVTVVQAEARFINATTLAAGGTHYTARRIVVATGSRPAITPIPGLTDVPYLTTDTLFNLQTLPGHLIIIGGGPIGLEMAQAFRRLGSDVTVTDAATLLAREDPEAAAIAIAQLRSEGIRLLPSIPIVRVRTAAGSLVVETAAGAIMGSHLLVATGRRPNIEGLGLDAAGIAFTARGITVDHRLCSSARRVYAIGDVAGLGQFTHLAGYHAGLVVRQALFALPARLPLRPVPRVTFTDPEVAQAGLTEAEARALHGDDMKVLRADYNGNDRAVTEADTRGFIKVITRRNRILGCTIVGVDAGEQIAPWVIALENNLPLRAMAQSLLPYPTRAEAGRKAAVQGFADLAKKPWLRRMIGVLSRLR